MYIYIYIYIERERYIYIYIIEGTKSGSRGSVPKPAARRRCRGTPCFTSSSSTLFARSALKASFSLLYNSYVCVYIYIYIYIYIYTYIYTCIYIYIYSIVVA